ncbi:MAG: rane-bound O-acyltransferase family protein, partial [Verrucomicrobiales bacterium]|nr:rane-bound O-acyltransferase family protein [Verrucomicrobiales bacterium]
ASLFFFGWWDWHFLLLLIAIASIDYLVGLALMAEIPVWRRKTLLTVSLLTNLGALIYFKYFNFFSSSLQILLGHLGMQADPVTLQVILPLGVSFYTFQALSYTIDVYRRKLPAVRDYTEYLCFITFFPHMVAGPIQQATHLLVQFGKDRHFDRQEATDGLRQMLWGYFKKMVVADSVAKYANQYFDNPASGNGWQLLWASYCFALQIYGDFSGYTDIAIGCARLFGLHMTRNFAYPYFSSNIHEFWKRWHISLSNWFRDYVYIPLGGSRRGRLRQYANALIVFVISGLWHGANWTFVLWGLLHGLYYTIYSAISGRISYLQISRRKWFHFLSVVLVFHLVALGWIFFRAKDLTMAFQIISQVATAPMQRLPKPPFALFGLCLLMLAIEWLHRHRRHGLDIQNWPTPARWGIYYAIVLMILFISPLAYVPFIYFQF